MPKWVKTHKLSQHGHYLKTMDFVTPDTDKYLRELREEQEKKFNKFDSELNEARLISRETVSKIILLCSTIIGFSLTLLSIKNISLEVNINTLRLSWYLFLATIVLGFLSLFIEGRLHYSLKWRAFQVQDYDRAYVYPLLDKIRVWVTCFYSLIFPRNLIFCKIYPTAKARKQNALLNAKTVITLAEFEKVTFVLENIFIILFVTALVVFINSYR